MACAAAVKKCGKGDIGRKYSHYVYSSSILVVDYWNTAPVLIY